MNGTMPRGAAVGWARVGLTIQSGRAAVWDILRHERIGTRTSRGVQVVVLETTGEAEPLLCSRVEKPGREGAAFPYAVEARTKGRIVWQRPDIEASCLYRVGSPSTGWRVLVLTADGCLLLCAETGETITSLRRGVQTAWGGADGAIFSRTRTRFCLLSPDDLKQVWSTVGRPIHSAAVSSTGVAYGVGGTVTCLARADGRERWHWRDERGHVPQALTWTEEHDRLVCLFSTFGVPPTWRLIVLSAKGKKVSEHDLGKAYAAEVFGDARHVLFDDGRVVEALSGKLAWTIP